MKFISFRKTKFHSWKRKRLENCSKTIGKETLPWSRNWDHFGETVSIQRLDAHGLWNNEERTVDSRVIIKFWFYNKIYGGLPFINFRNGKEKFADQGI